MEKNTSNHIAGGISSGNFLHQVCTSLVQDLPMQTLNETLLSPYVNPQNIECMVQMEMERIRESSARREEQYVEQMLLENPIVIESRPNTIPRQYQQITTPPPHQQQQQQLGDQPLYYPLQSQRTGVALGDSKSLLPLDQRQHRADACRRSRYNNKIKKAKSKYRHKYMSQKLLQSTQMFDCIQDLIAQAESHLLTQGLSKDKLQQMRLNYGIDSTDKVLRQQNSL
ncbi:protein sisterless A-like [Haematobia irritans]|uniref:protein sisterless A-like n=1 Tax=Haematobia irritans TaxID=7368 RepID=UPI003F50B575